VTRHPTARIVWLALLASQVLYLAVPYLVTLGGEPLPAMARTRLFFALAAVAAVTGAGSLVYRQRALVAPIAAGRLDPRTPEGSARAFAPYVLNLVLTESIAIHGLVLALVSHERLVALPFALAAFALMAVHRPTAPDLEPPPLAGSYRPPPTA
jgi:hypothetical protein